MISVITLTKDRAQYISKALDSIFMQKYRPLEVIILDSESKDNTEEIVNSYTNKDQGIKIVYKKIPRETSISKARNEALKLCTSEYITILDSDDEWSDSEKLTKQKEFLDSNPEHILIGTFVNKIDKNGKIIGEIKYKTDDKDIRRNMLLRNQFTQSSVMFRKNNFVYDENLKIWEDYDLWLKLGTKGKLANLPHLYTKYRVHNTNISKKDKWYGAKLHLEIIGRYKNIYPNYFLALIKGLLRFLRF